MKQNIKKEFIEFDLKNDFKEKELLSSLDQIANNFDIIVLGEPTHYGASTNELKFKLIKHLHKKHNFNVILHEGDFFALNALTDSLMSNSISFDTSSYTSGLPFFWNDCHYADSLFKFYIPNTKLSDSPLILNGFDPQFYSTFSSLYFTKYLENLINLTDSNHLIKIENIPVLKKNPWLTMTINEKEILTEGLSQLVDKLKLTNIENTEDFYNLLNYITVLKFRQDSNAFSQDLREEQMALNLKYLIKHKFPNSKIIISTHNTHAVKNSKKLYTNFESMISLIIKDSTISSRLFTIGITSRTGTFGGSGSEVFAIPEHPNSFEFWFPKRTEFAFLESRKINGELKPLRFISGFDNHIPTYSSWFQLYDAIFYIKTMKDCN